MSSRFSSRSNPRARGRRAFYTYADPEVQRAIEARLVTELAQEEIVEDAAFAQPLRVLNPRRRFVARELAFWPARFKEHNDFLYRMLQPSADILELAPDALTDPPALLEAVPEQAQPQLDAAQQALEMRAQPRLRALKEEARRLVAEWRALEDALAADLEAVQAGRARVEALDLAPLEALWRRDLAHKRALQTLTEARVPTGAYLDLLLDIQRELVRFWRVLADDFPPEEELLHWVNDSAGHEAGTQHMLNPGVFPKERAYVRAHGELAEYGHQLHELVDRQLTIQQVVDYMLMTQNQNLLDVELRPYMTAHPLWLLHITKENAYGLELMHEMARLLDPNHPATQALLRGYRGRPPASKAARR